MDVKTSTAWALPFWDQTPAHRTGSYLIFAALVVSVITLVIGYRSFADHYPSQIRVSPLHCMYLVHIFATTCIAVGTLEVVWLAQESTVNMELETVSWVWPPDHSDCSKVFALLYALSCPTWGIGAIVWIRVMGFRSEPAKTELERKQLKPRRQTHQFTNARVLWSWGGLVLVQIIITFFEQFYGSEHTAQRNIIVSNSTTFVDLLDTGHRPWHKRQAFF